MSQSGLRQAGLQRLHDILSRHVDAGTAPGLTALVSRGGDTHVEVIGQMGVESNRPMRRDAIFRIASMTKPVVAAAAMILVEECRLRFDDPVDGFLPELASRQVLRTLESGLDDTVPAARPITLRDLLTFRLGLGLIFADPAPPIVLALNEKGLGFTANPQTVAPPDEWMRNLGELPLAYQPGERWLYGLGSNILSVLIARAARQPLDEFLQERLFGPLGMVDSGFFVPASKLDRLTDSYFTNPATGELIPFDAAAESNFRTPPAFPAGAGGMVSTLDDYAAFARMLLNKGTLDGTRVLSPSSVALLTTDQLTPEQKAWGGFVPGYWGSHGWAFCLEVDTRRENIWQTPGRYGWLGGYGADWHNDPTENLITIFMSQAAVTSGDGSAIMRDFWTCSYQALDD